MLFAVCNVTINSHLHPGALNEVEYLVSDWLEISDLVDIKRDSKVHRLKLHHQYSLSYEVVPSERVSVGRREDVLFVRVALKERVSPS